MDRHTAQATAGCVPGALLGILCMWACTHQLVWPTGIHTQHRQHVPTLAPLFSPPTPAAAAAMFVCSWSKRCWSPCKMTQPPTRQSQAASQAAEGCMTSVHTGRELMHPADLFSTPSTQSCTQQEGGRGLCFARPRDSAHCIVQLLLPHHCSPAFKHNAPQSSWCLMVSAACAAAVPCVAAACAAAVSCVAAACAAAVVVPYRQLLHCVYALQCCVQTHAGKKCVTCLILFVQHAARLRHQVTPCEAGCCLNHPASRREGLGFACVPISKPLQSVRASECLMCGFSFEGTAERGGGGQGKGVGAASIWLHTVSNGRRRKRSSAIESLDGLDVTCNSCFHWRLLLVQCTRLPAACGHLTHASGQRQAPRHRQHATHKVNDPAHMHGLLLHSNVLLCRPVICLQHLQHNSQAHALSQVNKPRQAQTTSASPACPVNTHPYSRQINPASMRSQL